MFIPDEKVKRYRCWLAAMIPVMLAMFILTYGSACTNKDISLQKAFKEAVEDARTAEPEEISHGLVPIVYYNDDLVWQGEPGESNVLVITWTSWEGYIDRAGHSMDTTQIIWVVVPEELSDFCRMNKNLNDEKLVLRLEQLYGLPPHSNKTWFVEIWVDPDDLYRPSPDSDVTDCEAELDFPKGTEAWYREWFEYQCSISYGEDGYPWTRLGYTYDWGNPESEIGLSEFIIKEGSTVSIESVISNSDYLGKWD
ncbi:MAG: hypothetical protein JW712_03655 [Dehalococcoidales bacterium]|nr:hypothetical protein [Dehalococcoidales bacterium]